MVVMVIDMTVMILAAFDVLMMIGSSYVWYYGQLFTMAVAADVTNGGCFEAIELSIWGNCDQLSIWGNCDHLPPNKSIFSGLTSW